MIFTNWNPERINQPKIDEVTFTPGTIANLKLWQTTRLRLTADVEGRRIDLSNHNVCWESEFPELVSIGQGGLVQRVRETARPVVLRARLATGRILDQVSVPPT